MDRDCWSIVFTFTDWGDIPALAAACSTTAEACPFGIRRVFHGWKHLAADERVSRIRDMPPRAIYRNARWGHLLRLLSCEDRLCENDKYRLWSLMHWWRQGVVPGPRDIAWIDHTLGLMKARLAGPRATRLLETARLCPVRFGDFTVSPGGFLHEKDRPLGAVIRGRWSGGRWPRWLGEYLHYLENNPMRILTDAGGNCPFCGLGWDHPKAMGAECAMRLAEWASWIDRIYAHESGTHSVRQQAGWLNPVAGSRTQEAQVHEAQSLLMP